MRRPATSIHLAREVGRARRREALRRGAEAFRRGEPRPAQLLDGVGWDDARDQANGEVVVVLGDWLLAALARGGPLEPRDL